MCSTTLIVMHIQKTDMEHIDVNTFRLEIAITDYNNTEIASELTLPLLWITMDSSDYKMHNENPKEIELQGEIFTPTLHL